MTEPERNVTVCILAGDRTIDDPLCQSQGVPGKALVSLAGEPLLAHVLKAVQAWPRLGRIALVAPHTPQHQCVVESVLQPDVALDWHPPAKRLPASIRNVWVDQPPGQVGVIVTADHALLQPAWLEQVYQAVAGAAEVAVGLAEYDTVMAEFPGSRRTRYRFFDGSICGGNVFAFQMPQILSVLDLWQRMEAERKKPWKVLSLLGPGHVLAYLTGRLTLAKAFARLSAQTGVRVEPVVIDDGAVAVDIDSVADLALAEQALVRRRQAGGSC